MQLPDDFGDVELEQVIMAVLRGGPATEGEIGHAVEWAQQALIDAAMLSLVLDGRADIEVPEDGGDVKFRRASFEAAS